MKLPRLVRALALSLTFLLVPASAQVPQLINYQGRVAVGSTNFNGTGQFKFALVNGDGSQTFWSNDDTSSAGSEPVASVALPVSKGLYSVMLGDASLPNMQALLPAVFNNPDVRLRVWFNDGFNGTQLLSPDQRITAVGYAMVAGVAGSLVENATINAAGASFSGNVDIGSPATAFKLTVNTNSGYGIEHTNGPVRLTTYIDGTGAQLGTYSNHALGFFTANGDWQMTVYPNGNVGIGTSPVVMPAAKLQVEGGVRALAFEGNGAGLTGVVAAGFGQGTNQAIPAVGAPGTIGQIILSAGLRANGIPCNGQLLLISDYSALFSILGTMYGGNGSTTFAVPDLRAAAPNGLTYSILATGTFPVASP